MKLSESKGQSTKKIECKCLKYKYMKKVEMTYMVFIPSCDLRLEDDRFRL